MSEERIRYLQQIPVFALRQMVNERFAGAGGEARLTAKFQSVLNRHPRRVRRALARLTRQELTVLIQGCPEISDAEIATYFEQYRYGSHPSFYIYLFDPAQLAVDHLAGFQDRLAQALVDDNARFATNVRSGLPPLRDVLLNDFGPLPGIPGLYEGTYRFLSRLDYIDAHESAISTYETLYGFFWISTTEGYATIHARKPEVLKSLRLAIEEATGVMLTQLVISKQFKNALNFLQRDNFRSSRLYEPDPEAERFRSLTIADRRAYDKGYEEFETSYPELRSTSYRVTVVGKETTVRLTCSRGALSVAGRLEASQFRAWAVDSLGEVVRVLRALSSRPADYVQAYKLRSSPALAAYAGALQKDVVLELLAQVLALKQGGLETGTLGRTAADLALALQGDLAAQVACTCTDPECEEEESYLRCPVCEEPFFSLSARNGGLQMACFQRAQHWQATLPAELTLECGHTATIDEAMLRDDLELLPGDRCLGIMAQLVNNHLKDYLFDPRTEGFYIRGSVLHYYADKDAWLAVLPKDGGKAIYLTRVVQNVEANYGSVIGTLSQK